MPWSLVPHSWTTFHQWAACACTPHPPQQITKLLDFQRWMMEYMGSRAGGQGCAPSLSPLRYKRRHPLLKHRGWKQMCCPWIVEARAGPVLAGVLSATQAHRAGVAMEDQAEVWSMASCRAGPNEKSALCATWQGKTAQDIVIKWGCHCANKTKYEG
ncbi:hypothetical protein C8R45DRAFT_931009 [Mycena sanguinolenta]|nr:hypothetical protein C8R45DRAFT_931009 [Mycena sanguinolenta]